MFKGLSFYTLIHHKFSDFNTLNSKKALIDTVTQGTYNFYTTVFMQKLLIFKFRNLMPKFKYRITTAKELLKGSSGVKDRIILQRLYLFFKERKTHANARGCNIISTGSSSLSYVNVGENSAKRSKMSTDTSKTALCSLMKWFYVLHLWNSGTAILVHISLCYRVH